MFWTPAGCGILDREEVPKGTQELEDIFHTHFASTFPGYAPRPQQVEVTRAVQANMAQKSRLVAEAPTGVGKSMAYLVPAALRVAQPITPASRAVPAGLGTQIVIATAGIALQEQLITKDLPTVHKLLEDKYQRTFSYGLLKGWNNYLCHVQYKVHQDDNALVQITDSHDDATTMQQIIDWSKTTKTGDRSELPIDPPWYLWNRVSTTTDECPGARVCAYGIECWPNKARLAAMSNIVVTNYHMLLLALGTGWISAESHFIFDEAHELPDIARKVLGVSLSVGAVKYAVKQAERVINIPPRERAAVVLAAERDFQALGEYRNSSAYKARLRSAGHLPGLARAQETLHEWAERISALSDESTDAVTTSLCSRAINVIQRTSAAIRTIDDCDDAYAHSVEVDNRRRGDVRCESYLVEPGKAIARSVAQASSVTYMSATITTCTGFGYMMTELGCDHEGTNQMLVGSPFDFEHQAMLVLPVGEIKDTNDKAFKDWVARLLRDTVLAAKGRTLALFTSYAQMEIAARALHGLPWRVWVQGEMPKTKLIQAFRDDIHSVLLGVTSLWTGVDVPGEACSVVFVDKLPFPQQFDPVVDAIQSKNPDGWFSEYSLPLATLEMRQGVGRLIRSVKDRGVCVIADPRLTHKKYGKDVIKSLPAMRRSTSLKDIPAFLEGKL